MRNFLLFLVLATTLVANDKYAIQVLSVKNKASISEDFLGRVNKVSMPSRGMKGQNGYYKVYYGGIKTYKSAALILPYIQANVSADAFILKEKEVALSAHKEQTMYLAAKKPKIEKVEIVGSQSKIAKAKENWRLQKLKIKTAKSDVAQTVKSKRENTKVGVQAVKTKSVTNKVNVRAVKPQMQVKPPRMLAVEITGPQDRLAQANENMANEMNLALCKQVKKSRRIQEISEAVAFYASSSYHTFNK